jgi:hypothetical protein
MKIIVQKLSSGYYHIRGDGPLNWAQPPIWPCDYDSLREHAFPEASEEFLRAAIRTHEVQNVSTARELGWE